MREIWDSIYEDQEQFELTDAQKAELDRRLPFGKFKGQTLSWVYEQSPSYLVWFHETVEGCDDIKESIQHLDGIEAHLAAFRQKRPQAIQRQPPYPQAPKPFSPTQQEVEWLMGKFTTQTIDAVCDELFGGEK